MGKPPAPHGLRRLCGRTARSCTHLPSTVEVRAEAGPPRYGTVTSNRPGGSVGTQASQGRNRVAYRGRRFAYSLGSFQHAASAPEVPPGRTAVTWLTYPILLLYNQSSRWRRNKTPSVGPRWISMCFPGRLAGSPFFRCPNSGLIALTSFCSFWAPTVPLPIPFSVGEVLVAHAG
jgi:hypothetical protein